MNSELMLNKVRSPFFDRKTTVLIESATAIEIEALKSKIVELQSESDFLIQHLELVQQELEMYYLDSKSKSSEIKRCSAQLVDCQNKLNLICGIGFDRFDFNLQNGLQGTNWYAPEVDGCWGGPGCVSILNLPHLNAGQYVVRLSVADVASEDILSNLRVAIGTADGEVNYLDHLLDYQPVLMNCKCDIVAEFSILQAMGSLSLTIISPFVLSSPGYGFSDIRELSIKLSNIVLMTARGKNDI